MPMYAYAVREVTPTQELSGFLKMLGDPTRLKILRLLLDRELCVCQLVEVLGLPQPTVSQHLAKLRMTGLVAERKAAQWVYYRAKREGLAERLAALQAFLLGDRAAAPQLDPEWRRLESLPGCEVLRGHRQRR